MHFAIRIESFRTVGEGMRADCDVAGDRHLLGPQPLRQVVVDEGLPWTGGRREHALGR